MGPYLLAIALLLAPALPTEARADALQALTGRLEAALKTPARRVETLRATVDWDRFAQRVLRGYYEQLSAPSRRRLADDFSQRLAADLQAFLPTPPKGGLRPTATDLQPDRGRGGVDLRLDTASGPLKLHLSLRFQDDAWKIDDLRWDGRELSAHYRDLFKDVERREYSYGVLAARLLGTPYVVLEDFSENLPGEVPQGWVTWRDKDKKKPKLYRVRRNNSHFYVAAEDTGHSVILGKPIHWNPQEHPILTWCWRANALPPGGNERLDHANDSAAGLYVLFSRNWLGVPRQIKYVWSTTLPEGTFDRRPRIFRPYFLVLESGAEGVGRWQFEQVDLERDHRRAFSGAEAPKRTLALGLLTDANSTDSYAEADYADFRAWTRQAQQQGLIEDYCGCFDDAKETIP